MSLSVDHSPPRRPLLFPVVIATVFLTIIGMSAGIALGTRHDRHQQSATPPIVPTAGPTSAPAPVPAAVECPPEMRETARKKGFDGTLTQVLRVRAEDTRTTVWICEDPDGALFYQSNRGGYEAKWIEGETALFLAKVKEVAGEYVATAPDGNVFTVSATELRIEFKSGKEEEVHPVREE